MGLVKDPIPSCASDVCLRSDLCCPFPTVPPTSAVPLSLPRASPACRCAAWAIGRACGVTFLRLGSDAPFDLNSQSVVAAGHEGLAKELQRTLCAALVQVA